jgi:hypothetical protein
MASMKDFLTAYYNRLIFREMSHEQFVQFCGYIKDKKATDNQKIWAEELLKKNPRTGEFETVPGTNIYIRKDLPEPQDPADEMYLGADDKEWKKLFKAFQTAFQSMDGAKKDFKYNDKATKFLEQYFGSHDSGGTTIQHLFQYTKATAAGKQKIGPAPAGSTAVTLHGFLTKYKNRLELQLKNWGLLSDDFSYDDLLSGIASEKYNKNPKCQKTSWVLVILSDFYQLYAITIIWVRALASAIPQPSRILSVKNCTKGEGLSAGTDTATSLPSVASVHFTTLLPTIRT